LNRDITALLDYLIIHFAGILFALEEVLVWARVKSPTRFAL